MIVQIGRDIYVQIEIDVLTRVARWATAPFNRGVWVERGGVLWGSMDDPSRPVITYATLYPPSVVDEATLDNLWISGAHLERYVARASARYGQVVGWWHTHPIEGQVKPKAYARFSQPTAQDTYAALQHMSRLGLRRCLETIVAVNAAPFAIRVPGAWEPPPGTIVVPLQGKSHERPKYLCLFSFTPLALPASEDVD